ncbi:MAG: ferredoxin [Candidatus Micrarchaeota archaeon]|nr:ferredoxin [Candidatus Micrarchaeota archaeon]
MAKIIHDREACIGCGTCAAVCSKFWRMANDGKSELIGGKKNGNNYELEVKEIACNLDAAEACPVNCIHIEDKGKRKI